MRIARIVKIINLILLMLCVGCMPVLTDPGAVPTVPLTTAPIVTTPVTEATEDPSISKPTQPHSIDYSMNSGETLALAGGLTDEARNILKAGKTGYFLLAFSQLPDASMKQSLKDAGIKLWIERGWIFAEVPPDALEFLEKLSGDGVLIFGGSHPPGGKIDSRLAEAIRVSPDGTSEVSVFFIKVPDEAARKQIDDLFEQVRWPQFMAEAMPAMGGKIQNKNLNRLAEIPIIIGIDEAGGPVNQ